MVAKPLGPSKNPYRRIRAVDIAQNRFNIRTKLGKIGQVTAKTRQITGKGKTSKFSSKKIGKGTRDSWMEYVKRSKIIGKTEKGAEEMLTKKQGFETRDDEGNIVQVRIEDIKKRKKLGEALVGERVGKGSRMQTEREKRRRIAGSRISAEQIEESVADKLKKKREGEEEDEDPLKKVLSLEGEKVGMSHIGIAGKKKGKDYEVTAFGSSGSSKQHPATSAKHDPAPDSVVGKPEAEPLTGSFGPKQQDEKEEGAEAAKKETGSRIVQLAKGGTGFMEPKVNELPHKREEEDSEFDQEEPSEKSKLMEFLRGKYKTADDYEETLKTGTDD